MMKKLFLLMALLLVAGLCFAQYSEEENVLEEKKEKFDIELNIGIPVHWTNSPTPHEHWKSVFVDPTQMATIGVYDFDEDKTVTASTSIGVSLLFNFGKKMGFTLDYDVFFGSDVMGHSPTDSYSHTLLGMNALFGPVIYLYNGSFLRIPLALGLHAYYWASDTWLPPLYAIGTVAEGLWLKTRDFQLGPGLYLGIQFHFSNSLYIFSRTNVAFDFWRWHQIIATYNDAAIGAGINAMAKESWTEVMGAWSVKPAIGVGIKF